MKKYLFVSSTHFEMDSLTGAHRRFVELAYSFSESDDVTVVAHSFPANNKIKNIELKELRINNIPKHIMAVLELYTFLNKQDYEYDYVISFTAADTVPLGLRGFKNIITFIREDIIGYQKCLSVSNFKIWYWKQYEMYVAKKSDLIFVQCENDKNALIERTEKKIKNIEKKVLKQVNNANTSWMQTGELNAQTNIKASPVIVFIGNFSDNRKGHHILLPAIRKLLDDGIDFELIVIGGGKDLDKYKSEYSKLSSISFVGYTKETDTYLKNGDIVIVPSLIDSCPNTLLEGLSRGMAVYGANTGGIPDLLLDNRYMFSPESESLYLFLKEKIMSKSYIIDKKEQTRLYERLCFDWGKAIKEKIEHYFV